MTTVFYETKNGIVNTLEEARANAPFKTCYNEVHYEGKRMSDEHYAKVKEAFAKRKEVVR